MKRNFRRPSNVLGNVALMFVGLLLLLNPDFGSAAIAAIIGWGLIALGGLGLVICLVSWPVCGLPELLLSLFGAGFGLTLLLRPLALSSILGFGLGLLLVVQGVRMIKKWKALRALQLQSTAHLALGVITLVLAAVLMVIPLTASRIVMTVVGLIMILYGVVNLIFQSRRDQDFPPENPDIIDADV